MARSACSGASRGLIPTRRRSRMFGRGRCRRHLRAARRCFGAGGGAGGGGCAARAVLCDRQGLVPLGVEDRRGNRRVDRGLQFDNGHWEVTYDAANDWFALQVDGGDPFAVLRQFRDSRRDRRPCCPTSRPRALCSTMPNACLFSKRINWRRQAGRSGMWNRRASARRLSRPCRAMKFPNRPAANLAWQWITPASSWCTKTSRPGLYVNLGQDGTMFDLGSVTLTK